MTSLSLSGAYLGAQADCELLNKNWAGRGVTLLRHAWRAVDWVRPASGERTGFSGDARHGAFVQRVVKACVLLIALMTSGLGWSAGLGRLTLTSAAGQPFQAEIELIAVKNEEKSALTASLASQQLFRQANVEYLPLLATFQASIELRSNGQPYVRVISPQPVAEPLLNLLLELSWPSGRVVREYAVVLAAPANNGISRVRQPARTSPPVPAGSELLPGKSHGIDPWEVVRVLVMDADTEPEALKQTVIGRIGPPPEVGPVSIDEKEAPREVPQVSIGMEPERAHREANTSAGVHGNGGDSGRPASPHAMEEVATAKRSSARTGSIGEGNESIALLEKNSEDAQRPLEQKKPDPVQKQAEALTTGTAEVSPLATGPQSSQSAPSSPMQSETIHSVKATSATPVYEVTDEPVAVAKAIRAAWVSNLPDPAAGSSGAGQRKHTIADQLATNLEFLGGALVLLIAGIVCVSIARRPKGARNLAAENVASPVVASPSVREALPATINRETHTPLPVDGAGVAAEVQTCQDTPDGQTKLNPPLSGVSVDKPAEGRQSAEMKNCPSFSGSSGDPCAPSRAGSLMEGLVGGIDINKDPRSADIVRGPLLERGMRWRQILSQLDLARAYQEMGDKDAARQVLKDVIREGDAAQRESARRILANL
jgi:FimV-like protein